MSIRHTLYSLILLSNAYLSHAAVVSMDLHITNENLAPDGYNRSTVVAGAVFPAPLITGNKGDNFQLNVIDELTDTTMRRATSIHWHGLYQAGTNEMDGVSFVNQCPIIPGDNFLYNFSVPGQAGTFWYHSHLSTQYCDGLRGPLVLYDPDDPHADLYDVDDESTVITLADWYHQVSTAEFPGTNKIPPLADSTLINGLGRYSGNTSVGDLAVIRAQPGLRHRFRIVSTSCDPAFNFSIDGHDMTIIEADGQSTEPLTVQSLTIYAGQRYSVVVNANQTVGNYWIRANPSVGNTGFTGGINSAILRYDGADEEEPTTSQNTGVALAEYNLHALVDPAAPGDAVQGGADVAINLQVARDSTSGNFSLNGVTFIPPSVPVLLQILSGATTADSLLPSGSVYSLPANKVIEISFPGGGNHPFHLHGHAFSVVRSAGSSTYNYDNPVRRDVVSIGNTGDNVTFRFVTDNPGPWFLHCHIDWHLEAGLAVVLAEDAGDVASVDPPNDAWSNLCPSYNANNPDSSLA